MPLEKISRTCIECGKKSDFLIAKRCKLCNQKLMYSKGKRFRPYVPKKKVVYIPKKKELPDKKLMNSYQTRRDYFEKKYGAGVVKKNADSRAP